MNNNPSSFGVINLHHREESERFLDRDLSLSRLYLSLFLLESFDRSLERYFFSGIKRENYIFCANGFYSCVDDHAYQSETESGACDRDFFGHRSLI